MQTLAEDLRFAWRQLVKSPAFAVTAVVSLAIGLAASTTVFSLADALLLRQRPGIADPDRLVDIGRTQRGGGFDLLPGVDALDPLAFGATSGVFVGITLAASWLPARRAAARDPVEALRLE